MLDKAIDKILDFFIDSDVIRRLENVPALSVVMVKIQNKKFMIHIIKYLIFGILTVFISIASLFILIKTTRLNENICNILSIIIAMISAYVLNRKFVFESKEENIVKEFLKFVITRTASTIFDVATFFIFATYLSLNEIIVKTCISVVVIILNYIFSKTLVFKKSDY